MHIRIWEVNNSWQVSLDVVCIRLLFVHTSGAHMPWDWKCVLLCVSSYCLCILWEHTCPGIGSVCCCVYPLTVCAYFGSTHALGLGVRTYVLCIQLCYYVCATHFKESHMTISHSGTCIIRTPWVPPKVS